MTPETFIRHFARTCLFSLIVDRRQRHSNHLLSRKLYDTTAQFKDLHFEQHQLDVSRVKNFEDHLYLLNTELSSLLFHWTQWDSHIFKTQAGALYCIPGQLVDIVE